jgi:hypothetical protein
MIRRLIGAIEMKDHIADISQRQAATIAGLMFLSIIAVGVFGEFFLLSGVIVYEDAAATAKNIMAHAQTFRIAVAAELISFAGHIVLALALYTLLKPVNRTLALLALFWRLAESSVLGVILLNRYITLQILSGAEYLKVFEPNQLHALAMIFLDAYGTGYTIGVIFFCLGSTVFSYLFYKSHYIPKTLAALGIFASLLWLMGTLANLVLPNDAAVTFPVGIPIFLFETILGFWLIVKGVNTQTSNNDVPASP